MPDLLAYFSISSEKEGRPSNVLSDDRQGEEELASHWSSGLRIE